MSPAPTAATTTPGTAADGTAAAGTAALPPTTGRWPTGYRPPSQREGYDRTPNRRQRITESGARLAQLPDFPRKREGPPPPAAEEPASSSASPNCPTSPPAAERPASLSGYVERDVCRTRPKPRSADAAGCAARGMAGDWRRRGGLGG